jgi:hypothetical protein
MRSSFITFNSGKSDGFKERTRILVKRPQADNGKVLAGIRERLLDQHATNPHPAELREHVQTPQPAYPIIRGKRISIHPTHPNLAALQEGKI